MLIATLVVMIVGLVRRWSGRRKSLTGGAVRTNDRWGGSLLRVAEARIRRPVPVLAGVVTLAGMVFAAAALVPC